MGYDNDDASTVTVARKPQTSPINIPRLPGSRPGLIRFGPHRPTADSPRHTPRASRPSSPHNHPSFALRVDRFTDTQVNIPSIDAAVDSTAPAPPSRIYESRWRRRAQQTLEDSRTNIAVALEILLVNLGAAWSSICENQGSILCITTNFVVASKILLVNLRAVWSSICEKRDIIICIIQWLLWIGSLIALTEVMLRRVHARRSQSVNRAYI